MSLKSYEMTKNSLKFNQELINHVEKTPNCTNLFYLYFFPVCRINEMRENLSVYECYIGTLLKIVKIINHTSDFEFP